MKPSPLRWLAAPLALVATTIQAQPQPQPQAQTGVATPAVAPPDAAPAPDPAKAPHVVLARGALRVAVALPDARHGFYRATRFDWSGMITSVTMGRSRFYGPWFSAVAPSVHDFLDTPGGVIVSPRNTGTGPAEEFANRDGETVPGYNAAPAGGTFIKIGVGRLRKADLRPYDHFNDYAIVDGGTWTVQRGPDWIRFVQRLAPAADGYGYVYEKTIRLAPCGVMILAHALRNIGTKAINTQVYNHNLARFDDTGIGAGVSVEFPFAITGPVSAPGLARIDGTHLRYQASLAPGDRVQLPTQPGDPSAPPGWFRVTGANGATIAMKGDTPLVRTAFWSIRQAVAVEPFVAIAVAPGAQQRWSWRYVFTPGGPELEKKQ